MNKAETFHNILMEKMEQTSAAEIPSEPQVIYEELILPFFTAPTVAPRPATLLKAYPVSKTAKLTPTPQAPNPVVASIELIVLHATLNEDGKMKWFLFEKMVGQEFPEQITRAQAMTAFRKFIKRIHPDLSLQKGEFNFASFVKIKNEFIAVIEEQDPRKKVEAA